jgi:hypothetical protein
MTEADDLAERRLLEDFLLGRLSGPDAERVAADLTHQPHWQALAEQLRLADPLLDTVRGEGDTPPPVDPPAVVELMARLEKLNAVAGGSVSSPPPNALATGSWAAEPQGRAAGSDTQPEQQRLSTGGPGGARRDASDLSFLRPPREPDELGRLAGFRVLEVLGKGGMGLVLRAEDVQLRRQVALKVIRPEHAADPGYRERFLHEARAAAKVQHDHIIPVHQVGDDNGVLFLAMPLLNGQTLAGRLSSGLPLGVAEQLRIGRELAEGLAAAHAQGLIHRDLKPSNVWLEAPTGRVKILDFGLVRCADAAAGLTQHGVVVGTPAYMSPEQADGQPLDGRSDLFSLGVILYQLATGKQPFARSSTTATLRAVADHHPPAPHEVAATVPAPLSDLIVRLLAKSPDARPASAHETAEALRAIERGAQTPTPGHRSGGPSRRRGRRVAVLAAVVLLTGIGLAALAVRAFGPRGGGPAVEPGPAPTAPAVVACTGAVDVIVWTKVGDAARRQRLRDEGALPLLNGDQYRVEARVSPASYVYLFLIDDDGEANPLYPWTPGQWDTRPPQEEPVTELSLPPRADKGYKINGDGSGMWTMLLLARATPWTVPDEEIRGLFVGLPPQRPVPNPRAAVWFENGRVVKNDELRRPQFVEEAIDDPVLRLQGLLRDRLQPHASFTSAVSFAKQSQR